jgi:ABC-2 type transport system permease protein
MLRRILLIAKRDFTAAVMTKAFVIGLVVLPLLMGSGFLGFALMRVTQRDTVKRIAIVDHTGMAAAAIIRAAEMLSADDKSGSGRSQQLVPARYVFEEVRADDPLALSDRVRRHELAGFLEIGKDALDAPAESGKSRGQVALYTDTGNLNATQGWLMGAIDTGLKRARLARYGVDQSHFDEVFRGVPIESRSLVSRNEKTGEVRAGRKSSGADTAVPIVLMILRKAGALHWPVNPRPGAFLVSRKIPGPHQ